MFYSIVFAVILFFSLLLSRNLEAAKPDLSYGVLARTYPLSGAVFAKTGLGQEIWRQRTDSDLDQVLYGYFRPSLQVSSSGPFNSLSAEVDLFPISFFGVSVGKSIYSRGMNISFEDCYQVQCQGTLEARHVSWKLALGYERFFSIFSLKNEWWNTPGDDGIAGSRMYVEPATWTLLSNGKESTNTMRGAIGYLGSGQDRYLVAHTRSENHLSRHRSESTYFLYRTEDPGGSFSTYGIGGFSSELKSDRWSVLFVREWTVLEKLGLGL